MFLWIAAYLFYLKGGGVEIMRYSCDTMIMMTLGQGCANAKWR